MACGVLVRIRICIIRRGNICDIVDAGKCYPGWRQFDNKCYWYFGGAVTYATAYSFCKV